MQLIPDDPIVRSMERTGYPPWIREDPPDWEDEQDETENKQEEE